MNQSRPLTMMIHYKAWANQLVFEALSQLPEREVVKQRQTRFGNMVHTLNHVYVVDDIFKCHLLGKSHHYTSRNTATPPALSELWKHQHEMDKWYAEYVKVADESHLNEVVEFEFVGGGRGQMSRADMILHVVNHGTYHRGFIGDMMYQIPATLPANDLPVFLRDVDSAVYR